MHIIIICYRTHTITRLMVRRNQRNRYVREVVAEEAPLAVEVVLVAAVQVEEHDKN